MTERVTATQIKHPYLPVVEAVVEILQEKPAITWDVIDSLNVEEKYQRAMELIAARESPPDYPIPLSGFRNSESFTDSVAKRLDEVLYQVLGRIERNKSDRTDADKTFLTNITDKTGILKVDHFISYLRKPEEVARLYKFAKLIFDITEPVDSLKSNSMFTISTKNLEANSKAISDFLNPANTER